jgi:hypothetical protein
MAELMGDWKRTHMCGTLNKGHIRRRSDPDGLGSQASRSWRVNIH